MEPWLVSAAARRPERAALVDADGTAVRYAELLGRARAAAAALAERGVRRGDRVAIELPAGTAFAVTLHACLLLGAAAVPLDLRLSEAERAIRRAGARAVVEEPLPTDAAAGEAERLAAERSVDERSVDERFDAEAVALVVHTSGTTAAPRPVELTAGNLLWSALASAVGLGLDLDERWLCPMPLSHVGGLSILTRSAIYATTAELLGRFDADAVLAALRRGDVTLVSLVPTMLARLLDAGLAAPPGLRWVLLGGAPIPPALLDRARAAGVPVMSTYGMTEACSQIVTGGRPLPGVEVVVAADGEILVRGPNVAPDAVAADGWLHTGDLGRWSDDARLEIVGRKADTIVTGGENVAPAEVEAVLAAHPDIADAAVVGRPDPEWGERVVAIVVPRDGRGLDGDALRAWCRERLAGYKVPKGFEAVAELPRTPSGKLLRRALG